MQGMYQAYTTEGGGGGGYSDGQDWKVNVFFSNAYIDLSKNLESSSEKWKKTDISEKTT